MSTPEIESVLAQMRVLAQDLQKPVTAEPPAEPGFTAAMQEAVKAVNDKQATAANMVEQFETGRGDASITEVMVAMQKASVSFQTMTEMRNRLVEAYREIMSMPL